MTADSARVVTEAWGDPDLFTSAFRRYSAGVSIITARTEDGWFGLTASSVATVSADPPMLSFSMPTIGRTAEQVVAAATVGVHLLPVGRTGLAEDFARRGGPRFTSDQGWKLDDEGELYLPDSLATLTGTPQHVLPAGASSLVVIGIHAVSVGPASEPLTYQDRTFRGLGRPVAVLTREQGTSS